MLRPAVHRGKDTTHKTWRPCVMRVCGLMQQCWKSFANGSNIVALRYDDHGTSSWELLTQKFDRFHTLCNNSQQHATASNNGNWVCKRTTMLGGFGRQCCVRLHRASETETFIMIATRSFNIFLLCMLWPNITPHTSCKMIKLGKECYLWTPSNFNNLKHLYLFIFNLFFFNFQSWENKQKIFLPVSSIHLW